VGSMIPPRWIEGASAQPKSPVHIARAGPASWLRGCPPRRLRYLAERGAV
jgi:hypothetical protein